MRAELANLNYCAVPFLNRAVVNLSWYDSIPIAGWTDHGSLTNSPVHISNILYVRTKSTDTSLKWKVTLKVTEPNIDHNFSFIFSIDEDTIEMMDEGSPTTTFQLDANPNDLFSFSAYNSRGGPKEIYVGVSHNGNAVQTAKLKSDSQEQNAKYVKFEIEKQGGTTAIEACYSIANIYGGKRHYRLYAILISA